MIWVLVLAWFVLMYVILGFASMGKVPTPLSRNPTVTRTRRDDTA